MGMQYLRVSHNRRFLTLKDGTPFFWLGDTAWSIFHLLTREEAELYLKDRQQKKFNVIQVVALAEPDGLETTSAYGRKPLLKNGDGNYDPTLPDLSGGYSYWDHIDYILNLAEEHNLYMAFLPTWGDKYNQAWGKGPEIFNKENAFQYGKWLGERYKERKDLLWVLGGDRKLEKPEHLKIIRAMAAGIKRGDEGRHLMTFHPAGGLSSSASVQEEDWHDFNMLQSGHNKLDIDNYNMITHDYQLEPTRPVLDAEPRYDSIDDGYVSYR